MRKHTQGKWIAKEDKSNIPLTGQWDITSSNGDKIAKTPNGDPYLSCSAEWHAKQDANAQLIAEAGTVANETGKTPRQLVEESMEWARMYHKVIKTRDELVDQNTEMLEALKAVVFEENDGMEKELLDAIKQAQKVINKAEGKGL